MAKRRRTETRTKVIRVGGGEGVRSASPIVRIQSAAPRAAPKSKRRLSLRRRRSAGILSGIGGSGSLIGHGLGGLAYGFAVKQGWIQHLPAIPVIGRTGAAALVLDYWAKHGGGQLARNGATAAAVLAGYQLGSTGAIMGDDTMGMDTMGDSYAAAGDSYAADGEYADGMTTMGDDTSGELSEGESTEGVDE